MKTFYLILGLVVIALMVWLGFTQKMPEKVPAPSVLSFEDCLNAGYPVMESNPRQCRTPDGRTYAEEIMPSITYVNTSQDFIVPELPFPGAVTGKEFTVTGKAKGFYFEASFPVDVLDKDGNVLVHSYAQAQGDWMTAEFVPYKGEIKVPTSYIGPATLVLRKDNPSGLPEHEGYISYPITIEY